MAPLAPTVCLHQHSSPPEISCPGAGAQLHNEQLPLLASSPTCAYSAQQQLHHRLVPSGLRRRQRCQLVGGCRVGVGASVQQRLHHRLVAVCRCVPMFISATEARHQLRTQQRQVACYLLPRGLPATCGTCGQAARGSSTPAAPGPCPCAPATGPGGPAGRRAGPPGRMASCGYRCSRRTKWTFGCTHVRIAHCSGYGREMHDAREMQDADELACAASLPPQAGDCAR